MKVLFTSNIPSPYRVDFFNELGKYCELTVVFENSFAKNRNDEWKNYKFQSFEAIILKGYRYGEAEAFCPGIIKIIKKGNYDKIIVGIYSSLTGMYAIDYLYRKKIPFIISTDGGLIKETKGIKAYIKQRYISRASQWLSTGKNTNEYLMAYGAKEDKIWIYPFASMHDGDMLRQPLSNEEKKTIRKKLGLPINKKIIVSVGQFIYRKGFDILEQAAEDMKDFEIYIIGGIKEDNENVHYMDFMPKKEVYEYYKAADLFVLPTREDIWGLVINEAMAFGIPVVTTTRCVAGMEMVIEGENGFLIPTDSPQAIIEAVNKVEELDGNKSIEVAKKYSIEAMVRSHLEMLNV